MAFRQGTDEDDSPGGLIVEHHRLDPMPALGRALGWGAAAVTVGALVMAAAIVLPRLDGGRPLHARALRARDALFSGGEVTIDGVPVRSGSTGWEIALGALGLACIVVGGGTAIVGLRRVLTEEAYLALRTDGAYFRNGAERSLVRWDDVEEIRHEGGAVVFARHDGTSWVRRERFAGIEASELARRAAEIRRKALFGLLR